MPILRMSAVSHCQHSDQVTDRFAIKTETVAKVIAVFNACCELKLETKGNLNYALQ